MERLQLWDSNLCPCCLKRVECKTHLFQCEDKEVKAKRAEKQLWVLKQLQEIKTHPKTISAIMYILHKILNEGNNQDNIDHKINQIIMAQQNIGFMEMMIGRWTTLWKEYQAQQFKKSFPNSNRNGLQWATQAMKIIWQYNQQIWLVRNNILHNKGGYDKINDIAVIDEKIKIQFNLGTMDLQ